MKFDVLGRNVDLRLTHVLLNLGALLAIMIPLFLLGFVAAVIVAGSMDTLLAQAYQIELVTAVSTIFIPLGAYALLAFSGFLKMKKDVSLCRSLASGYFALSALSALISAAAGLSLGLHSIQGVLSGFLVSLASSAAVSILMYLWLLIFLKPDKKLLTSLAPYALLFAIAMLVVGAITNALSFGISLSSIAPDLQDAAGYFKPSLIYDVAYQFLFAIPLLYFTFGKGIEKKAAYLFAGLYLGARLLSLIALYDPFFTTWIPQLYALIKGAIALVLLYLLARFGANNV